MQRRADDYHKQGQLEEAISTWLECFALAEDHQDSLARKTEFLCILVDLHLQASNREHHMTDGEPANILDAEAAAKRHREEAKRYLHRIKPALVQPAFWSNSTELFDFLVEDESWELALLVGVRLVEQLGVHGPGPEQFATVHFQIASQKLDSNRQGEALHHLQATVKYMQMIASEQRDMEMYLQVLELIASEYNAQGQSDLALDTYRESLKRAPLEKHASLCCRMAHVHLVSKRLDKALELLEAAASSLEYAEPSIRLELLQTKGDVYCRLGRMDESLQVYQCALEEVVNPAEKAKLLYTLGRLCVRLKHVRLAISYFTQEMEITEAELGKQHLSVSRVLHELAKLYDEGLGEHKMAMMKLRKALDIELAVLQECHFSITKCPKCNQVTHRMCPQHAALQRDVSNQIRETKKMQGRIHFKLGDFERALQTSFDGTDQRGYRRSSIA
jgi:tetratricopeptide (TPR) repeat protein